MDIQHRHLIHAGISDLPCEKESKHNVSLNGQKEESLLNKTKHVFKGRESLLELPSV